ncbi:plasmid IncI1-type surface exclusion protein ExcA [Pseudomonas savastanoi]|uniref:plasmid IncI1-type surface exclusion protein ExcA n=4 Tax=Pseudomonas savastanoi TaxID=29438 RepID=UPI0006B9BB46|nr:plasmid IncI1-type surface exclusion protein ExcA [Pseudomonas savastanoi]PYD15937.1 ethanolamine utilization protein EutG [Pseudomonas savastanoi pv. glycinea]RMQ57271.1 putative exclusion-determining protein [Pseudomonas savastanoi pv. glycinea]RMR43830.1 putative exclusion-determining protein [Pseudomonas savastanoi pv. glycinea]
MAFSKPIQRLKTPGEAWLGIVRTLYMLFAFPFLLFFGVAMLAMTTSSRTNHRLPGDELGTALIWAAILLSVGIFAYGIRSRKRTLKSITAALRDPAYFSPDEGYEIYQQGAGKYLGIDTRNGTILYVHRIRKGEVDVVALTMNDWTKCEVEGTNIFRLFTQFTDLPRLEIFCPWAERWYDTIGVMRQKQYTNAQAFKQHVHHRLEALERDLNVQIPRLA